MKNIHFTADTNCSEIQAHFACGTNVAEKICNKIIKMSDNFEKGRIIENSRDVNYPGTHGTAPYDLLMFAILNKCQKALEFYAENRFPNFGDYSMFQLIMSVGKNYADTGYIRKNYKYTDVQMYFLNILFGEEKTNFKNPGYCWGRKIDPVGYWENYVKKLGQDVVEQDELAKFQYTFGLNFKKALDKCKDLPLTVGDMCNFILDGSSLKTGSGLSICLPNEHSKQENRHMRTCKELFEKEFVRESWSSIDDGISKIFGQDFYLNNDEIKNIINALSTDLSANPENI